MIFIHVFIHGVILHNRCSPLAYKRYSGSGPFSPIVPFSIYSLFPLLLLMLRSPYSGIPTPYICDCSPITTHEAVASLLYSITILLCMSVLGCSMQTILPHWLILHVSSLFQLSSGENANYINLLNIFAYGTYADYKGMIYN